MSIFAEFRVSSPRLALSDALEQVPDMTLELIQQIGTEPYRPYMFIWAHGDCDVFESALKADESVTGVEVYSRVEDQVLYRMQIAEGADLVAYPLWVELGADQLEARWSDGWWHVRMRFPCRDAISSIECWCAENDVRFELERLYADEIQRQDRHVDLTAEQRETLLVAHQLGYFSVPREADMDDIAAEIGVSNQAISERIRRAHSRLVEAYVR